MFRKTATRVWRGARAAVALSSVMVALVAGAAAQTPDPSDIAEGARLFHQKANCQTCHGWAGDGRKMDNQMPDAANLRESVLGRDVVAMTIKCGRPGTGMPAFDKNAYSDGRCFGLKAADLRRNNQRVSDPPATLQPREIDYILDFLFAKVIGQGPMDHAKCIAFWDGDTPACAEFPQ